jgi:hypothetical protein
MLSEVIFPYKTMSVSFAGGVWTEVVPTVLVVNRGLMALQVTCIAKSFVSAIPNFTSIWTQVLAVYVFPSLY